MTPARRSLSVEPSDVGALLDAAPDALVVVDQDGVVRLVNAQAERLLGWPRAELVGQQVEVLVPAGLRGRHAGLRQGFLATGGVRPMGSGLHLHAERRDGALVPIEVSLSNVETPGGRLVCAALRDITERAAAERALRDSEERFRLALEMSPIGMAEVALDGRWLRVNRALCALLGYGPDELLTKTFQDVTHPEDLHTDLHLVAELLAGTRSSYQLDKRYVRADGAVVWVSLNAAVVRDAGGAPVRFIAQVEDISARREHSEALRRLAETDVLTGLANRTAFIAQARAELETGVAHGGLGLLLLDLDHFKDVNDALGHQAGDALLVEVARRLDAAARVGDVVARFGGDEFAVLLRGVRSSGDAAETAERLLAAVRARPVLVPDATGRAEAVRASATVGACVVMAADAARWRDGLVDEMYRRADVALYAGKGSQRGTVAVYDDAMAERLDRRLTDERLLRAGLDDDRVVPFWQPVVDLRTDRQVGHEALVRLVLPDGGLLGPEQLLAAARDGRLLPTVDLRVLRHALPRLDDADGGVVHLNVSAETLRSQEWADAVRAAVEGRPDTAARLHVDVSEDAIMAAGAAAVLGELRALRVRVGLDDFGTGYSALSYLQELAVDYIKVDRSLVEGIGRSSRAEVLVRALVDLAHALALEVVAEGVSRPEQLAFLREVGCDGAQGHLLGVPAR